jgi:membrane-associated phospholipid phosphatase
MKHAGSTEDLKTHARQLEPVAPQTSPPWQSPASQSLTSKLVVLTACLLLVAVFLDAPVRALALSLDPSLKAVLRGVTGFGNSAWPLGIGLALLALFELLRRSSTPILSDHLKTCRSVVLLVMTSVALSGFLASLTKHMIGRIRPSTDADAMVLEFSVMAFRSGWAAFPSGHATTALAAATALALCFPRHAWGWMAIGALAAVSRALIGVHWLTDCLAGMVLGAVVATLVHQKLLDRGHQLKTAPIAVRAVAAGAGAAVLALARFQVRRLWQRIKAQAGPFHRR